MLSSVDRTDRSKGELMKLIGTELGKMHVADIIHGDLTTSNLMLKRSDTGIPEIVSRSRLPSSRSLTLPRLLLILDWPQSLLSWRTKRLISTYLSGRLHPPTQIPNPSSKLSWTRMQLALVPLGRLSINDWRKVRRDGHFLKLQPDLSCL